jgi:peptidoglycan hydrolase CwlO-like protein
MSNSICKKNKELFSWLNLLFLVVLVIFVFSENTALASVVNLDKIINTDNPEKLDKYKNKVEKQLKTTTQQKNILTSQVKLYDLKVNKTRRTLANIEKEYQRNELELQKLKKELTEKDKKINYFKNQLKKTIINYERNNQDFKIKLLSSDSDITSLMNETEYLNKLSKQIKEKVATIKKDKEIIIEKEKKIKTTKEEMTKNKEELKNKKEALESQKRIKNDFLKKTQGDENKYKELLSRIDEQKRKLVNLSLVSTSTKQSINQIKESAKKPKTGLASTSWYYAQDNSKWGYKTIGFSKTLMKDYGCAVTALSMVFSKEDKKINPGKLAKKPLFYQDLIVWPNSWGKLKLVSGRSHGNINWKIIDKKLKKKIPVVVFIRSRGGAGHYVVVHHKDKKGKYVVHDPLFGANIYLETSKKLISSIYKSGVVVDQMIIYE